MSPDKEHPEAYRALLRVGAWGTVCCHLDLYPLDADDVVNYTEDFDAYLSGEDDSPWLPRLWATRTEALDALEAELGSWGEHTGREEVRRELAAMRADPTLCGSVAIAAAVKS